MEIKLLITKGLQRFPLIVALFAQLISLIFIKIGIQLFHYNLSSLSFLILQIFLAVFIGQVLFK